MIDNIQSHSNGPISIALLTVGDNELVDQHTRDKSCRSRCPNPFAVSITEASSKNRVRAQEETHWHTTHTNTLWQPSTDDRNVKNTGNKFCSSLFMLLASCFYFPIALCCYRGGVRHTTRRKSKKNEQHKQKQNKIKNLKENLSVCVELLRCYTWHAETTVRRQLYKFVCTRQYYYNNNNNNTTAQR